MASSPIQMSFFETFYERHRFKELKVKSVTNEPAVVCHVLLPQLIDQILGHMQNNVSSNTFNAIMTKLSGMLQKELEERDIPVSMSPHHIQRAVRAVHKELCKEKNKNEIIVNLLVLQDKLCTTIVDTLVKYLMRPRKTLSIRKFFSAVYTSIVKSLSSYETLENEYEWYDNDISMSERADWWSDHRTQ